MKTKNTSIVAVICLLNNKLEFPYNIRSLINNEVIKNVYFLFLVYVMNYILFVFSISIK